MNVAELIDKLALMPRDAKVVIPVKTSTKVYPVCYRDPAFIEQCGDDEVRIYVHLEDNQHVVTRKPTQ